VGIWWSFHTDARTVELMAVHGRGVEKIEPLTDTPLSVTVDEVQTRVEAPSRIPPLILPQPRSASPVVGKADASAFHSTPVPTTFDHRPIELLRVIRMRVTAYSPDERSCGIYADGYTASGYSVWTNAGRLVAADTDMLPFGTILRIPGYDGGSPVPVLDRGGAIKGHRLDVLFASHEAALEWGVKELDVEVWGYVDVEAVRGPNVDSVASSDAY
jgi:3D (Asp-Asp-Asp) domain-containing protein